MRKLFKLNQQELAVVNAIGNMQHISSINYRDVGKQDSQKKVPQSDANYYEFIPNGAHTVIRSMFQVKRFREGKLPKSGNKYSSDTFLDVGSGLGNILALAKVMDWYSRGVEYDEDYKKNSSWGVKDATDYMDALDYTKYNRFDIIYFYQPIVTPPVMNKLLEIIDSQISKGTIIMCYPACDDVKNKVKELWGQVFNEHYHIRIKN